MNGKIKDITQQVIHGFVAEPLVPSFNITNMKIPYVFVEKLSQAIIDYIQQFCDQELAKLTMICKESDNQISITTSMGGITAYTTVKQQLQELRTTN